MQTLARPEREWQLFSAGPRSARRRDRAGFMRFEPRRLFGIGGLGSPDQLDKSDMRPHGKCVLARDAGGLALCEGRQGEPCALRDRCGPHYLSIPMAGEEGCRTFLTDPRIGLAVPQREKQTHEMVRRADRSGRLRLCLKQTFYER